MDWSSFSIGNAAGFIKGPGQQFNDALRSAATYITIGSLTINQRDGNPGSVYQFFDDGTSVNALGLPNPGIDAIRHEAENMAEQAQGAGKHIRWSLAGFSVDEYVQLSEALFEHGRLELNLGCPNVWGDSGQKPIAAFDLDLMKAIITEVSRRMPGLFFDIKVSPYSDPSMIQRIADLVRDTQVLNIVTCNTFPNAIAYKDCKRALQTPNGYGGMAGNGLFPIALGQVAQFAEALGDEGPGIIGVGGINSGERVRAMNDAGATGIQIGTAFGEHGAGIFSDVLQELAAVT
ncbi:MAG: Dihydroorotate oxidase [Parcubacteria group bacterium]|nr:Dihydroorotate oxidase [Parcubacteria group bacterium]